MGQLTDRMQELLAKINNATGVSDSTVNLGIDTLIGLMGTEVTHFTKGEIEIPAHPYIWGRSIVNHGLGKDPDLFFVYPDSYTKKKNTLITMFGIGPNICGAWDTASGINTNGGMYTLFQYVDNELSTQMGWDALGYRLVPNSSDHNSIDVWFNPGGTAITTDAQQGTWRWVAITLGTPVPWDGNANLQDLVSVQSLDPVEFAVPIITEEVDSSFYEVDQQGVADTVGVVQIEPCGMEISGVTESISLTTPLEQGDVT